MSRSLLLKPAALALLTALLAMLTLVGPMTSAAEAYPRTCKTKTKGDVQTTTCIQITKIYDRKFNVVYRDGVKNSSKGSATMTCVAEKSKTWAFDVSVSVKAEAGAIFAKVSGEVRGGVSHSVTTKYGASVTKKVPGKTTMFCDRGIYTYKFKGTVTKVVCSNVNCQTKTTKFTGNAPQRALWHVYYGH